MKGVHGNRHVVGTVVEFQHRLIPIEAASRLYLIERRVGDESRFVRLFQNVWGNLPATTRGEITSFWERKNKGGVVGKYIGVSTDGGRTFTLPRVELVWDWAAPARGVKVSPQAWVEAQLRRPPKRRQWRPSSRKAFAVVYEGAVMRFRAPAIDASPDWVVEYLIAHELAHVNQSASGKDNDTKKNASEVFLLEYDADVKALGWGYDYLRAGAWYVHQGWAGFVAIWPGDDGRRLLSEFPELEVRGDGDNQRVVPKEGVIGKRPASPPAAAKRKK